MDAVRVERERGRLALVVGCRGRVAHTPLAVQIDELCRDCFWGELGLEMR
jgi:hypothetical protein